MGLDCAHPFNSNRVHFLSKIVKILTQGYSATFPWHWFRRALCKFTCCMIVPCSFTPVPRVLAWYSWWHQSCNLTGCQTFFSWTFAPTFNIIPSFNMRQGTGNGVLLLLWSDRYVCTFLDNGAEARAITDGLTDGIECAVHVRIDKRWFFCQTTDNDKTWKTSTNTIIYQSVNQNGGCPIFQEIMRYFTLFTESINSLPSISTRLPSVSLSAPLSASSPGFKFNGMLLVPKSSSILHIADTTSDPIYGPSGHPSNWKFTGGLEYWKCFWE